METLAKITRFVELGIMVFLMGFVLMLAQKVAIMEEALKKNAELSVKNFMQASKKAANETETIIKLTDLESRVGVVENRLSITNKSIPQIDDLLRTLTPEIPLTPTQKAVN